jgi:hypothetical protein
MSELSDQLSKTTKIGVEKSSILCKVGGDISAVAYNNGLS